MTTAAPLAVARRRVHTDQPTTNPAATTNNADAAPPPSSASSSTSSKDLQLDDTDEWILSQVRRSVESGRQSKEAADYFRSILHAQPEFHQSLREARRLMGGQEPEQLTRYQQGQFADRLCNYMSGIASEKLRRASAEEQSTRRYTQDGTPTGENYWFEAGNTLGSPAVPGFVKDEVLHDMQQERAAASPAFLRPPEETQMAEEDDGYAAHLRRQRDKLLRDADFK
ncbi:putative mitochondrial hypothetical protein [Leptomonas pyrrhocoris]|uniref:Uncharacterized protein n=1 Tax=Leptomonas pyrrhocoris TaxID=157538 RepID=A0A0N0DU60_LEPPY|nr:putative mitochondrial hypothetical protein [Leptomonas pyrrhocoris]XP_015656907.1 putative mitochondrial hypothetical protein [Leptomonas pyrrhocoris]KPA78467.1 putative mitochondrial hypothetical protein [Leptomonas pyrrhocoris]KPA78468.1 putative mitochondrial hypothetical protein [Leptomonas pyrrhocoris]|eukprot:XP_015656906.1 putative mitochondrial hypothetical protein [Leptomonas pyrrhocoris]